MGKKILMVLMLSVALVFAASPAFAQDKVYVNGIDANFPPFAFVDKNGVPDGFDVKALEWIAKDQGFKVKHQPMDWDGII
ncbi:MAG: extracellular solute-binding protein, family 3, partial [Deltaproteobacteria bacterium]|nr:extracellular solute-binding protein, family 3 [Deltaproteobacteria bacterium]